MEFTLQKSNKFLRIVGWSLLLVSWVSANPVIYNDRRTIGSETERISSLQRNARHVVPSTAASEVYDLLVAGNEHHTNHGKDKPGLTNNEGFFKTYHSDADGLKDYVNETFGKADHGYKKHDKFNKKDKDNYAFKNYAAFGLGEKGKKENYHHKKNAASAKQKDHEGSGTSIESHYIDDGDTYSEGGDGDFYSSDDGEHYGESGEPVSSLYSGYEQYSSAEGNDESKHYSNEDADGFYSDY